MTFKQDFGDKPSGYVCEGDTITCERDGFTCTVANELLDEAIGDAHAKLDQLLKGYNNA
jgi:hypothetical protein